MVSDEGFGQSQKHAEDHDLMLKNTWTCGEDHPGCWDSAQRKTYCDDTCCKFDNTDSATAALGRGSLTDCKNR